MERLQFQSEFRGVFSFKTKRQKSVVNFISQKCQSFLCCLLQVGRGGGEEQHAICPRKMSKKRSFKKTFFARSRICQSCRGKTNTIRVHNQEPFKRKLALKVNNLCPKSLLKILDFQDRIADFFYL